ncbi:MAG: hypothetical protein MAG715_01026 [Methanonatronarchaeales archaeon]|nr:hypothetical protein [Methanonatronarchaeales archaeon]
MGERGKPEQNLRKNLRGIDEADYAIFLTFNFDPAFFENVALKTLSSLGVRETLVLTDISEYQRSTDTNHLGHRYYLDYVPTSGTFHPKVCLLSGPGYVKVLFGSFNLTNRGWDKNGEIADSFEFGHHESTPEEISAIRGVASFIDEIIKTELVSSQRHQEVLRKAHEEVLEAVEGQAGTDALRFLHNLQSPILPNILDIIEEEIEEAHIISPFWDEKGEPLKMLAEAGCSSFQLYIQPEKVRGFPHEAIPELEETGCKVGLREINFSEEPTRFIHGKALILKGHQHSYCLYGSPNLTRAALLTAGGEGNIETAILRKALGRDGFDHLISSDSFTIEKIDLKSIAYSYPKFPDAEIRGEINIQEALLKEKQIRVKLKDKGPPGPDTQVNVQLTHPKKKDEDSKYLARQEDDEFVSELDEGGVEFCSEPTQVRLEFVTPGKEAIKTRWRWLSKDRISGLPPRRTIREGERTEWRDGIIEVLEMYGERPKDRLALSHFLSNFDFTKLDYQDSDSDAPPSSPVRGPGEDSEEETPKPLETPEWEEIRENAIKKITRELEKAATSEESPELALERSFNRWMALWKFVLWSVLRSKDRPRLFVKAREPFKNSIKPIINQLEHEQIHEQEVDAIIQDLRIQLPLVCFLIDDYYLNSVRDNVIVAVEKNWFINEFLAPLGSDYLEKLREGKFYSAEKFEAAKSEYSEFDEFSLSHTKVTRYIQRLLIQRSQST